MHCHCCTNNRAPTFTDPYKPEVRPGAREESASPDWLAAPAMNARDTTNVYIWRLLDRQLESVTVTTHQEKGILTLESNPSATYTTSSKNIKYKRTDTLGTNNRGHGGHSRTHANQRWDQVLGRSPTTPWLVMHDQPNFNCTVKTELLTDRQTDGQTDDPNTRCPKRTIRVDRHKRAPVGDRGFKSRMCPPYPRACRKRRLKSGGVIAQVADTALS